MIELRNQVIYGMEQAETWIMPDGEEREYEMYAVNGSKAKLVYRCYDRPHQFIIQKITLAKGYSYNITGQTNAPEETVYFTKASDVSNYGEMEEHIWFTIVTDKNAEFTTNLTMDGDTTDVYVWKSIPLMNITESVAANLAVVTTVIGEESYEEYHEAVIDIAPCIRRVNGDDVEVIYDYQNQLWSGCSVLIDFETSLNIETVHCSSNAVQMSNTTNSIYAFPSVTDENGNTTYKTEQTLWTDRVYPDAGESNSYNHSFNGIELTPYYIRSPVVNYINNKMLITAINDDYVEAVGHKYNIYNSTYGFILDSSHRYLRVNKDMSVEETCTECNGTGEVGSECSTCNGTGKVAATASSCGMSCYLKPGYWRNAHNPGYTSANPLDLSARKETIVWTAVDLYDDDGNLYMSGSTPEEIPLYGTFIRPYGSSISGTCLSADTLITMPDFTCKRMDEIVVGDKVMSKDGEATKVVELGRGIFNSHHTLYTFDDGTVIDEISTHRFFNETQGFYQNLEKWDIGDRAKSQNGSTPALVSVEQIDEEAECFGLWTESGTYYANGLLSGSAECNTEFIADATTEKIVDMVLSMSEIQIIRALKGEGLCP